MAVNPTYGGARYATTPASSSPWLQHPVTEAKGWWAERSDLEKGAVVVGGLSLVGLLLYAFVLPKPMRANKRRRRRTVNRRMTRNGMYDDVEDEEVEPKDRDLAAEARRMGFDDDIYNRLRAGAYLSVLDRLDEEPQTPKLTAFMKRINARRTESGGHGEWRSHRDFIKPAKTRARMKKNGRTHPAELRADRQRALLNRLKKRPAAPIEAKLHGASGMTVLVHKSTKKPGYWQATFFDKDGEPWGDSESQSYTRLLEHIHGDSVDWRSARRMKPNVSQTLKRRRGARPPTRAGYRRVKIGRGDTAVIGRSHAPAKYVRKGARRAADYGYPDGYMYPLVFRTPSGKVKPEVTKQHIRVAAARFGKHKRRYPLKVRRQIARRINQAKSRYGVGGRPATP